jgi:selenocysteine lyase/cysteine desulfurase
MSAGFTLLTKKVYLAACSHSPIYKEMVEALDRYKEDLLEFGNPWELWVEKVQEAKRIFASLIGASPDEVCPHFSVSSAFGSLLSAFEYSKRKEIVLNDLEYPTTNYIVVAQTKRGAKPITIKSSNYKIGIEQYEKAINENTKLVCAIHVSSLNGFKQKVNEIAKIAHAKGAEVYVDAYQSAGNTFFDVKRLDVDYLCTGTLKYLLGLPGLAFLYVRNELIQSLEPVYIGWFSQKNPFKFGAESLEYAENAERFQSGTWCIPSVYASIEGLKIIKRKGLENIQARIAKLTKHALEFAQKLGLQSITPIHDEERGAIVSFVVKQPHKLEEVLRNQGIITSSRDVGLRIAPHFYNTKEEIENAVEAIARLSATL